MADIGVRSSVNFDSVSLIRKVKGAERKVLMRFGAFVRVRSRQLFRKRKKISDPLQPPVSHLGLVKNKILFAMDEGANSVVIGPEALPGKDPDALARLEAGGRTIRLIRGRRRAAKYRPRPFMFPSFEYEKRVSLPTMLADSIK